jgi:hypothetical protein
MVPKGHDSPKASDFIHWSELIADAIVPGPSSQEIRGYLKTIARSTWQLVSWLTHAANAVAYDGEVAVNATHEVLNSFGTALVRSERKTLDRCPRCNSLRLQTIYQPDSDPVDAVLCESCAWNNGTTR